MLRATPSAQPTEAFTPRPRSGIACLPARGPWPERTLAAGCSRSSVVHTAPGHFYLWWHSQEVKQLWFGRTLTQYIITLSYPFRIPVKNTIAARHLELVRGLATAASLSGCKECLRCSIRYHSIDSDTGSAAAPYRLGYRVGTCSVSIRIPVRSLLRIVSDISSAPAPFRFKYRIEVRSVSTQKQSRRLPRVDSDTCLVSAPYRLGYGLGTYLDTGPIFTQPTGVC